MTEADYYLSHSIVLPGARVSFAEFCGGQGKLCCRAFCDYHPIKIKNQKNTESMKRLSLFKTPSVLYTFRSLVNKRCIKFVLSIPLTTAKGSHEGWQKDISYVVFV